MHVHIEQYKVDRIVLHNLDGLLRAFHCQGLEVGFKDDLQSFPKAAIIVGNQNSVITAKGSPLHASGDRETEGVLRIISCERILSIGRPLPEPVTAIVAGDPH
jgi:hypothetical protein